MLLLLLTTAFIMQTSYTDTKVAVTQDDLNQYLDDSIAAFKLQLHQASQCQHTRIKRTINLSDFMNSTATVYESQIASITPVQSEPLMHPVESELFEIQNSQYLAVVNFQDENFKYQTKSATYITTRHLDSPFSRTLIQVAVLISSVPILARRICNIFASCRTELVRWRQHYLSKIVSS